MDGLHVAIAVSDADGWSITSDILGILPVYVATRGEVTLAASSPGLLRMHEKQVETLDLAAVTSLLLTNSVLDGETLIRGVQMVASGHQLVMRPGQAASQVPLYRIPVETGLHDASLPECASRLHDALASACRRHVPSDTPHGLLLSGGLDSRLLAGALHRLGVPLVAITRGIETDNDFRFAARVAGLLGVPHRMATDESGSWVEFRSNLGWNGVVANPGLGTATLARSLEGGPRRVVSGYLMDAIVGGSHLTWYKGRNGEADGFDTFFRNLNVYGIPIATLPRLLRADVFGDSVAQGVERVRARFESLGDTDAERTWRYDLGHRQRFLIGGLLVRQTPGAWPSAPHIDREVLGCAGAIDLDRLAGRLVEREILVRFYRDLARLPLDRGNNDTRPLYPPGEPGVVDAIRTFARRGTRRIARTLGINLAERRYYTRTLDFEGPAWHDVRRGAESVREAAHDLFDRTTFDTLLPPVGQAPPERLPFEATAGRKVLLGIAAWAAGVR
jgi:asparagine synthase (glutamine-hydrolysing)